ncbi:MAG: hypothetical protein A2046_07870 [Bacteroidetes bacterium GWA2_30_7]|nr:MAG: hypothetical protein A2046_07870 [Bacteroidetes bacterium GWA2_30_7]
MHINTIGGSHGKASADFTNITSNSTDYLFNQHSTIELNGTDKQTWYVDNVINTTAEQINGLHEKGDVRRSKNLKVYIPGHDNETYVNALNTDGTTVSSQSQEPLLTIAGNILAGSLPGQIFRLRGTGNEEIFTRKIGQKKYEIKDHLQSSIITVSDVKKPIDADNDLSFESAEAQIISYQEFYPGGMIMPSRKYNATEYRFGYGGHEKIDEVTGVTGAHVDMGDRWLDTRIGRTSKLDSKASKYPSLSPYSYVANNPIKFLDPDGKEIVNSEEPGTAAWKKVDAAISVVKRTNPELYNTLHALPEKINVSIGKLNPESYYGATTTPTGRIELGVSNYSFETSGKLGITNTTYDNSGNPLDAQVSGKMSPDEQEDIRTKLWDESGGNTENYYKALENTSFEKTLSDEEASNAIKLHKDANGVIANIIIDPLNVNKKSMAKSLAHEFGHTNFAIFNTVKAWIWKSGNLGDPNTSKGKGHDTNNPSGKAAEAAEKELETNY